MYRYYLFFYQDYYPLGGMEDCVLKTNNYDDLVPYINEHYGDDWYLGTIAFYDAVEDKYFEAIMEKRRDTTDDLYEFSLWEEKEND